MPLLRSDALDGVDLDCGRPAAMRPEAASAEDGRGAKLWRMSDAVNANAFALPAAERLLIGLNTSATKLKPQARHIERSLFGRPSPSFRLRIVQNFEAFWLCTEHSLNLHGLPIQRRQAV